MLVTYLPVHRDGEDGPDVGQHGFESLGITVEVHFCQYQRLFNILEGRQNKILACGKKKRQVSVCDVEIKPLRFELLVQVQTLPVILPPPGGFLTNCSITAWINIYLLVQTLWLDPRYKTLLFLSLLCTFCPRCSCRQYRTLSAGNSSD